MAVAPQRKTKRCPLPKGCGRRRRLTKFSVDNAKASKHHTYCSDCTSRRAKAYRQSSAGKSKAEIRRQQKAKRRVAKVKRLCAGGERVVVLVESRRLELVDIDTAPQAQGQYRLRLWDGKRELSRVLAIKRLQKGTGQRASTATRNEWHLCLAH